MYIIALIALIVSIPLSAIGYAFYDELNERHPITTKMDFLIRTPLLIPVVNGLIVFLIITLGTILKMLHDFLVWHKNL